MKNLRDAAKDVKAETATGFWSAAVAKVHPGVGFAPATAQLSAIGFFDGSETGGIAWEFLGHALMKGCCEMTTTAAQEIDG